MNISVSFARTHILTAARSARQKNWAARSDRPRGPHSFKQAPEQTRSLASREKSRILVLTDVVVSTEKREGTQRGCLPGFRPTARRTLPSRQRRTEIAPGPISPISALDNAAYVLERCNENPCCNPGHRAALSGAIQMQPTTGTLGTTSFSNSVYTRMCPDYFWPAPS